MAHPKVSNFPKKLLIASPRGFCAGVQRAITALNQILIKYPGQTIFCYHQIVHNKLIVQEFEQKGVKFIDNLEDIPDGSILVFSAHGVSPQIKKQAAEKNLTIIDATCPFVEKTHSEVKLYAGQGYKILYLGKPGHDEAVGTSNEAPDVTFVIKRLEDLANLKLTPTQKIALVTQTTLSLDDTQQIRQELKKQFPNLVEPSKSDICLATQNRQNGVKKLVELGARLVIVLGSVNSSNSKNLQKIAEGSGAKACLIDQIEEVDPALLSDIDCVGLTAGASLPEEKLTQAIEWFRKRGVLEIEDIVVADENSINFSLPKLP